MTNCKEFNKSQNKPCTNTAKIKGYCGIHAKRFITIKTKNIVIRQFTTTFTRIKTLNTCGYQINYHYNSIISDIQMKNAEQIVDYLISPLSSRYAILVAQMQSGKSGCMLATIELYRKQFPNLNVILIIPLNDNEVYNDQKNYFNPSIHPNNILSQSQLNYKNALVSRIDKNNQNLILIDESDVGSKVGSLMHKRFIEANISPTGNKLSNKISIVSISATAMTEISSLNQNIRKEKFVLETSPDYYGVLDMLNSDNLRELKNLDDKKELQDFCMEISPLQQKYYIIRVSSQGSSYSIGKYMKNYFNDIEIIDRHYSLKQTTDINTILSEIPKKPTILFIYNSLRASKRLKCENIGLIYESSDECNSTNQGLVGRLCGYNKPRDIIIYVNKKHLLNYGNWIKSEFSKECVPHIKSIEGGVLSSDLLDYTDDSITNKWTKNVPILIPMGNLTLKSFLTMKKSNNYDYNKIIQQLKEMILSKNPTCILSEEWEQIKCMIFTENNAESSINDWWENPLKASKNKSSIVGFNTNTLNVNSCLYMYVNLIKDDLYYNHVILVYSKKIKDKQDVPIIYKSSNPKENSMYHIKNSIKQYIIKLKK
jgi:hypothetical protein